jgi:ribosomal protein L23
MNRQQLKEEVRELFEPSITVENIRISKTNTGLQTTVTVKQSDYDESEVNQRITSKGFSILNKERNADYIFYTLSITQF